MAEPHVAPELMMHNRVVRLDTRARFGGEGPVDSLLPHLEAIRDPVWGGEAGVDIK